MFQSLWTGRTRDSSVAETSSVSSLPQAEGRGNVLDSRKNREPEQTSVDPADSRPVARAIVDNSTKNGTLTTTAAAAAATVDEPVHLPNQNTPTQHVNSAAVAHRNKPRTPRSASAIKDGRKFLAAYRRSKAASSSSTSPPDATPVRSTTTTATEGSSSHHQPTSRSGGGIEAVDFSPGLAAATFSETVWRNQAEASGLARNLEGLLSHNSGANRSEHPAADVGNGGSGSGMANRVHGKENIANKIVENGPIAAGSLEQQRGRGKEMEEEVPSDGPGSSSPSRSPERPTAQAIRQAGQRFQADFLSTVLSPVRNGNGNRRTEAGVLAMHERRTPATLKYGQHPSHSGGAGNGDAGFRGSEDRITSPVDEAATAKWDALQRLQSQNLGLGTAAEHQLGRALELCRDIRGWKGGALGQEQTSSMDALQSILHGLSEIMTKKRLVDKTAHKETKDLGGPAVICDLLDTREGHEGDLAMTGIGGCEGGDEEGGVLGWVTGAQLKAFESQIRSRSSLEIAALKSERRKLKEKIDMFQRQVQFLQRESADRPVVESKPVQDGDRGCINGASRLSGESPGFASLFDARLGDDKHLQVTLEAEIASLRGSLEEKDGLIDALRQALRSAATAQQTAATYPNGTDKIEHTFSPSRALADQTPPVPGYSSGRRHSGRPRPSRFLEAAGPEATSKAASVAAAAAAAAAAAESGVGEGGTKLKPSDGEKMARGVPTGGPAGPRDQNGRAGRDMGLSSKLTLGSEKVDEPLGGSDRGSAANAEETKGAVVGRSEEANAFVLDVVDVATRDMSTGSVDHAAATATADAIAARGHIGARPSSENDEKEGLSGAEDGLNSSREANGGGVKSRSSTVPSAAWRAVWGSARAVGATVGFSPRKDNTNVAKASRHRSGSSHAVLIL